MLSNKPEINLLPIYVMFKDTKSIFNGNVYQEVKQSLETYDIALRRLFKNFEDKKMTDNPLATLTESAIYSVAELEFYTETVFDEATAITDENTRLKEEIRNLREQNYKLKLLNQSLKF
tara:strand:- start:413 stop:769 length:357 start_codon:yes stop_codon:yes gene_type:complete